MEFEGLYYLIFIPDCQIFTFMLDKLFQKKKLIFCDRLN